jgi:hypothetical protein
VSTASTLSHDWSLTRQFPIDNKLSMPLACSQS